MAVALDCPTIAYAAEPVAPTLSNYGGVGVIDTRSARFLPDGNFSVTVSKARPDDRIAATFQALPWAEVTFRYAINTAFEPRDGQALYDRSFDVKFRLVNETPHIPALAIGFQDFIGTGTYSGQYIVGSKAFGPFDFSLGLGWGRLASRGTLSNPFGLFGDSFKTFPAPDANPGGQLRFAYFRGPDAGVFGGVTYATPIRGLKLQVEYTSDTYAEEQQASGRDYSFPINIGLAYQPWPWLDIGVSYMRGRSVGLRLSTIVDPTAEIFPVRLDRAPRFKARDDEVVNALQRHPQSLDAISASGPETHFVDLTAQGENQNADAADKDSHTDKVVSEDVTTPASPPAIAVAQADPTTNLAGTSDAQVSTAPGADARIAPIFLAVVAQRLNVMGIDIDNARIRIVIENKRYRRDAEAIARTARALSATAPAEINFFDITVMKNGQPLTTVILPRSEIDALANNASSPSELWLSSSVFAAAATPPIKLDTNIYPRFNWDISPVFRPSLFDPDNPFYFKIGVGIGASAELARGLFFDGFVSASLYDNFDEIRRGANSVLPHVRSDIAEYLKEGDYGLEWLTASYFFKLSPTTYGRVSGGYLEQMFAGVGGEFLYRPFGQRWAVGADIWAVRQRDFNVQFDLRSYETFTGHVSFYYQTPWYDIDVALHGGRYLAGDYGATFEASRSFSTGVRIGAWFTLTNVSAARFGEGSFDKGIRIVIPLEWVAPFSTQNAYTLELRPIQRDGGQRLYGTTRLYNMTAPSDYGALSQQWGSVFAR